jgi:hypothetical protein
MQESEVSEMVGGIVIEVAEVKDQSDVLFIDCHDRHYCETCAIYVEKNETSLRIEPGDSIWWQGRYAMWTPKANADKPNCGHRHHVSCQRCGVDYDIRIPRVGYSGAVHPAREQKGGE